MLCRQRVSDEEFLVLWENYESKNPNLPQDSYDTFTPKNMRDAAVYALTCFEKNMKALLTVTEHSV